MCVRHAKQLGPLHVCRMRLHRRRTTVRVRAGARVPAPRRRRMRGCRRGKDPVAGDGLTAHRPGISCRRCWKGTRLPATRTGAGGIQGNRGWRGCCEDTTRLPSESAALLAARNPARRRACSDVLAAGTLEVPCVGVAPVAVLCAVAPHCIGTHSPAPAAAHPRLELRAGVRHGGRSPVRGGGSVADDNQQFVIGTADSEDGVLGWEGKRRLWRAALTAPAPEHPPFLPPCNPGHGLGFAGALLRAAAPACPFLPQRTGRCDWLP